MDPASVEARITPRTEAIWVTHLFGYPAEVDKLREIADRHGIYLLEDCAHVVFGEYKGKKLGTWGHIGTFSFNCYKQLSTGEGGMAITDDHVPFLNKGMHVIDALDIQYGPLPPNHDAFTTSSPNYHHTLQDTFDKVSAKSLQIVGDVAVTLVK
jgi:selenocysteine lyase/cysteine desulfurase